jgi:hypothetical protein
MQNSTSVLSVPAIEQINLEVNKKNLFKNLSDTFSDGTKVLSELLQNARRAGAKSIRITTVSNTFIIEDDGCGISDFKKLFVHSESGWDEKIVETEKTFGIGWFSTLYCAKQVQVESRGRQCLIDTEKTIQDMQPISISKTDYIGKTRITLIDFNLSEETIEKHLKEIVYGFPVPVFFNGKELERPHAIDQLSLKYELIELECGTALIHKVCTYQESSLSCTLYFQGLPIKNHYGAIFAEHPSRTNVLHLDNSFKVRLPDRDCLIDPQEANKRIENAFQNFWQAHLNSLKRSLSPEEFIGYFNELKRYSCLVLLNDIDIIPVEALDQYFGYPCRTSLSVYRSFDNLLYEREGITRAEIESGKFRVVSKLSDVSPDNEHVLDTVIFKEKWLYVKPCHLDSAHWINDVSVDASEVQIHMSYQLLGEDRFHGNYFSASVQLVENISIFIGDLALHYNASNPITFAIPYDQDEDKNTIIVCGNEGRHYAIEQLCDYETDDVFDEQWLDNERNDFDNLVAILRGENFTTTVKKALTDFNITSKSNCINTASVCFVSEKNCNVISFSDVINSLLSKLGIDANDQQIAEFIAEQFKIND